MPMANLRRNPLAQAILQLIVVLGIFFGGAWIVLYERELLYKILAGILILAVLSSMFLRRKR